MPSFVLSSHVFVRAVILWQRQSAVVLLENKMAAKVGVSCVVIIPAVIVVYIILLNCFLPS